MGQMSCTYSAGSMLKISDALEISLDKLYFIQPPTPSIQRLKTWPGQNVLCLNIDTDLHLGAVVSLSRHPMVKWAQRSDKVYITIELPDAKDVKLNLEPEGKFYFSATSGADKIPYEVDIDLHDNVNVDESKASIGVRNICYLVKKTEKKWWSRLLKQEGKPPVFLKVDWDKWVDEDEEQEHKFGDDMDFGGMDFSNLNLGGAGDFDMDDGKDEDDGETKEEAKKAEDPTEGGGSEAKA